jgi:hypothetical protein
LGSNAPARLRTVGEDASVVLVAAVERLLSWEEWWLGPASTEILVNHSHTRVVKLTSTLDGS